MALLGITDWNILFVYIFLEVCQSFEQCEEYDRSHAVQYYKYCEYSCCGYIYNRYCCENFSGVIAGAVVGSLVFLGIVITVIVCVLKKKGQRGAVIGPVPGGHVTQHSVAFVTATQIQPNYSQPPPAYGVAPGYQATYSYQSMYGPSNSYPPPPPSYSCTHDSSYPPTIPAFRD